MSVMSDGEARSRSPAQTMTSYCSPSFLKRVTWRPPSIVSSVRPTLSTLIAEVGELVALDRDPDLGRVEPQVHLQVLHAGVLAHLGDELLGRARELRVRHLRHDHVLDRRRSGDWPSEGGLTGNAITPGICRELRPQLVGDLLLPARALLPRLQAQHRVAVDDRRKAGDRAPRRRLRDLRVELLDRPRVLGRVAHRRALRRAHDAEDHAAILGRRQLGFELREQQRAEAGHHQPCQHDRRRRSAASTSARAGSRGSVACRTRSITL